MKSVLSLVAGSCCFAGTRSRVRNSAGAGWTVVFLCAVGVLHAEGEQASATFDSLRVDDAKAVELDVFKGPQILTLKKPKYPEDELWRGAEARIGLSLMVDAQGKPYEITPVSAMGAEPFVKEALRVARSWRFEPGKLNGVPVDSGYSINIVFQLQQNRHSARRKFMGRYHQLRNAMTDRNQEAARAALTALEATNLYEEAFRGFASAGYYALWGTRQQALAAMASAVSVDHRNKSYLPKDAYRIGLRQKYQLELELGRFQDALDTWATLEKTELDAELHATYASSVAKVEALKQSDQKVEAPGTLDRNGSWFISIFKKHFSIAVQSGRVQELKLRCDGAFVFFSYDPEITYATEHDGCGLQVLGTVGTEFVLTQH